MKAKVNADVGVAGHARAEGVGARVVGEEEPAEKNPVAISSLPMAPSVSAGLAEEDAGAVAVGVAATVEAELRTPVTPERGPSA